MQGGGLRSAPAEARHVHRHCLASIPTARWWRVLRTARHVAARSGAYAPGSDASTSEVLLALARAYADVQEPALANRTYTTAVEEFTQRAVEAYACGHNEADVQAALGVHAGELRGLKGFDEAEFAALVALVWVTLTLAPVSVRRWATVSAVSDSTLAQWKGFVAMIVEGYFFRRMAWFPLDRLALELAAVQGRSLPQELVAERARVVFTTLEQVYPQFAD
ncbi:hypothetical protein HYH03_018082 [Edaphochlamys debaryana]|uniref:DUF7876 domain-containing protein n=1 Tax=Edaphochlamys debaryana TaxID=47281 RepID=A0A835XHU6_9CHLO|nr:hypothetical protein HYH03_018082 [Edaphochlamys debaryana]|eukprot:KAG2483053.1 hypothetical protein HYH03_018082 [Edaphochlamys debaryana]